MSTENMQQLFREVWRESGQAPSTAIPNAIQADPGRFLEAMMRDGMLERTPTGGTLGFAGVVYAVVQPHVHKWRVTNIRSDWKVLSVRCAANHCPYAEGIDVPNRIPLEVPE
jgi:hypothetical protein